MQILYFVMFRSVLLFIPGIKSYFCVRFLNIVVMWKIYALLSAVFAALTAIFAKIGVKNVNSDLATAIRTSVILLLTWGIVIFSGQLPGV